MISSESIAKLLTDFGLLAPELLVSGLILLVLILSFFKLISTQFLTWVSVAGLIAAVVFMPFGALSYEPLSGMIQVANGASLLRSLFLLSGAVSIVWFQYRYKASIESETLIVILGVVLGANLLVVARSMLMVYLGVEVMSISSYAAVHFSWNNNSREGSMKYILYGAFSSGVMLYGISLLYGISQSMAIPDVVGVIQSNPGGLYWVAITLFMGGLFFKASAAPFHFWTPDVYQSTSSPVVALFSVVPKVAALFVLFGLSVSQVPGGNMLESSMVMDVATVPVVKSILAIVAIVTICIGNLAAIVQDNVKRLLAYSSIAHAGFLLVPVVAGTSFGREAFLFYSIVYMALNYGVFWMTDIMTQKANTESIKELAGQGKSIGALGIGILVMMIGLAGLPPSGGFSAKLLAFSSLVPLLSSGGMLMWGLFAAGLLQTVVALFFYLKMPYYLYFKKSLSNMTLEVGAGIKILVVLVSALTVMMFVKMDAVISIIHDMIS